jgi:nicotinate-nucleotide adenylyltransferase
VNRIGILGGSFDPIHHGHLIAAGVLAESLGLDEVRLVVARAQPLKPEGHGAAPEDRARMVELAVAGDDRLVADRSELGRAGPSYTVDTLRALREANPQAELVLLLGSDAAEGLADWREPAEVRALCRIATFTRGGAGEGVPVPRLDISSTVIRERVRSGRSVRYWVPEAVLAYIGDRGLYRAGAPAPSR